jgi:hypothetical protein
MMINKNIKNGVKVMHLDTLQELNRENSVQSLNSKVLQWRPSEFLFQGRVDLKHL